MWVEYHPAETAVVGEGSFEFVIFSHYEARLVEGGVATRSAGPLGGPRPPEVEVLVGHSLFSRTTATSY